jgi:DNA-binding XRE family transcriptional regulator
MAECRMREYRTRLGMRREDLAARSKVSLFTLARLEMGKLTRGTAIGPMLDLAHAMGLSPADVWPVLRARPQHKPPGFSRLPVPQGRGGRRMGGEPVAREQIELESEQGVAEQSS